MVVEAVRTYLDAASGLTELTRKRAVAAAKTLLKAGDDRAGDTADAVATGRVGQNIQALATDLMETNDANRQALGALVQAEVERAVANLDLVPRAEYERLSRRVAELERRLAARRTPVPPAPAPAAVPAPTPMPAAVAAPAAPVPVVPPVAAAVPVATAASATPAEPDGLETANGTAAQVTPVAAQAEASERTVLIETHREPAEEQPATESEERRAEGGRDAAAAEQPAPAGRTRKAEKPAEPEKKTGTQKSTASPTRKTSTTKAKGTTSRTRSTAKAGAKKTTGRSKGSTSAKKGEQT
ncbi:polyhydroxyalkanoate synthesis regulator phasin [Nocardiopsis mwathae]|uniref:Polyhydroxyalkanoate synthesis regulator phasin n=1 Tax=Nocardiopsis mwathae TaxID=1472723 RepID=A0A7W9YGJ5_9ACTN|nr:membrane fusogenic activity family protein [Nocardiopsis mwathae]MBB6171106.1 polyhydroxyalkanoate synthesis regulator phasin [Nocardiopsis mwathae]